MATRPGRKDYASWNYAQFVTDSILWNTDPLFGWCNKNYKKDGSPYNIYSDTDKYGRCAADALKRVAHTLTYNGKDWHEECCRCSV